MTISFEPWMALAGLAVCFSSMFLIGRELWGRSGRVEWVFATIIGGSCLGGVLIVVFTALSLAFLFGIGVIR